MKKVQIIKYSFITDEESVVEEYKVPAEEHLEPILRMAEIKARCSTTPSADFSVRVVEE